MKPAGCQRQRCNEPLAGAYTYPPDALCVTLASPVSVNRPMLLKPKPAFQRAHDFHDLTHRATAFSPQNTRSLHALLKWARALD